ncbi:uncharacterized protein EI90DRAFT_2931912 [Cantharellus anzutake]|uniref:uncharacterized protein n=1 Tax=Cantharellus anzutake TaxID=1750568 RepID=UPI001906FF37|nr:uncharacterized protein EI90DRAFT_2931912 [Cantharellus anzutake]KAF8325549.1 hypothetical protein EI90DRAFT_2931912 [Cantharellus anzutake]
MATEKPADYRLPTNVKATHYDLTIKTDLEVLKFWGYVIAHIDILEDTSSITLNASDLSFALGSIAAIDSSGNLHKAKADIVEDKKQERVTFQFEDPFKKGSSIQLRAAYEAELGNSMLGYYVSSWNKDGKKRYAYRDPDPLQNRAFPSWDEPLLKATYAINLISRSDTVNLSNMPSISEIPLISGQNASDEPVGVKGLREVFGTDGEGWKVTVFEKTPKVSSYLVAFANGHFAHIDGTYTSPLSGEKRPLRVYATPDIIHQGHFALEVKSKTLPLYEQVFDVEFPLPKLDTLVAADFDAGAMENWGLITGRTTAFLFDPKKSDLSAKKRVAQVQAHEVAHMWFGNITTMAWWDSLWLNEGFATLMGEVIILNKVFPEFRCHSSFINDHLQRALKLDAQRSSHPIQVDCPDANQINQFDALSYSKAASMLRMLSQYVSEEKFLKGVSIYLKNHLYANSEPVDLWNGVSEATGIDVSKMMDNWVWKIGYPVLTVTVREGDIHVRQDRFIATGDVKEEENQTIWHVSASASYIPLTLLSTDPSGKTSIDRKVVLNERETTIVLDTTKPWKLNAGTVGVYRVSYEPEVLKQLGTWAAEKGSPFSLEDRMGLVNDAITLAKAGTSSTSGALDLITGLKSETENLVWQSIASTIVSIKDLLWEQPPALQERFRAFEAFLFLPIVERLGYESSPSDTVDDRELRTLAVGRAARARHPAVLAELRSRFAHFLETGDDSKITSDLQRIIYSTAVRFGGRIEYEAVKAIWRKPPTPSAKNSALIAIMQSEDAEIFEENVKLIFNEVPLQDWHTTFAALNMNTVVRRKATGVFKNNYDEIIKRFEGNFSLGYIVKYNFESYTTEADRKETKAFFEDKDNSKYNMALNQALDSINANATWLDRSLGEIERWLREVPAKI